MNRGSSRPFFAVSLVSAATLIYEIGLTRVFSVSQGYHLAFMVISIALLGIGAGGAVVMLMNRGWGRKPKRPHDVYSFLSNLSALFSIVAILSFVSANRIMFDPVKAAWSRLEFMKILAQYLILSLPFLISGMVLSTAYKSMSDKVHRLYFADMAGAGAGSILILYILSISGGEAVIIVSGLLSLLASLLFLSSSPLGDKGVRIPVIAKLVLIVAVLGSGPFIEIRMSPYRELSSALNFPGARVVDTLFSPSGRMDIVESPAVRAAPGISLTYQNPLPPQLGFTLDGGGLSTVTSPKGDLSFLQHLPSSLPYRLRRGGDVFIVDPGGGMEVLSALENGAKRVNGAETKGIVLSAIKGRLSTFSGRIYNDHEVRHGYAKNILKRTGGLFDIIQLPLTDTLGASSSGIMGLQEEYNLTVEAFSEYFRHLKKGGFVSASIYLLPPPRQELKLLSTIAEAISLSSQNASDRIMAVRSWGVMTILAKEEAVTQSEIDAVKGFCKDERFDMVWYPGMKEDEANIYNRFQEPEYYRDFKAILGGDRELFFEKYIFDVRPASDDRPFFGQTFKITRVMETYESVGKKWGILIEGGYLLPWIFAQSLLASVVLIMAPLFLRRPSIFRQRPDGAGLVSLLSITCYFSAIGIGYMFLEISLMQRMTPALGEPIYAISAVLFTLLLSTGIGSYLSGRFMTKERHSIHLLLIVPLFSLLYFFLIGPAADYVAGMGIMMRFVITFLLFFPLGMAMGIPFPTGMSILKGKIPELIPWAWCINGSFSVISSVLAMMAALTLGFSAVHLLAVASYFVAWTALLRL